MDIVEATPAPAAQPTPGEIDALAALVPDAAAKSTALPGAERSALPPVPPTVAEDSAAAPAEGEPAAEPPPAAAPEADEALARAEAAAKKAKEGSRRFRAAQEQQRQAEAAVQKAAAEAAALRKEAEDARKLKEVLLRDPYAALKHLGMKDQDLAERALREGTPEALIHQMNERLEAERKAREALEGRLAEQQQAEVRRSAEERFFRVADDDSNFPRLAALSAKAQLATARAAIEQITENGYDANLLTDRQVAEACEEFLAPKRGKGKGTAVESRPAPKAPAAQTTLTNKVAAQKATQAKEWHELDEDEQIAAIAASLPG